jgi:hypothetical protein
MKEDKEFTLEMLADIFRDASTEALVKTVEAVASALGVSQIQGMPIQEFHGRRKQAIAEEVVAGLADGNPELATQIKKAWDQVIFLREKQEEDDRRSRE